jgi:RNA polymerase sigma factor (TIGR02999 family)
MSNVTEILERVNAGTDPNAAQELANVVYEELRIIARARMRNERAGHTLQPTALVNEAWLKLFPKDRSTKFSSHGQFFGAASKAMRRILVNYARERDAKKRGKKIEIDQLEFENAAFRNLKRPPDSVILAVNEALEKFAQVDPTTGRLVEMRFFVGLTMQEAAKVLRINKTQAERDYAYFKAWFKREYRTNL